MTWIGDGGSSTGVFHEGLNFAAVQKAPFVLILENNQWAYSTPVKRQVPIENLADRAKAYGIASYVVDGNDVVAVYQTAKEAVDRARDGQGPILIEAKSMRMRGHAQHDPAEYVPKEMFAYWKQRDPIEKYEKFLLGKRLLDAATKKQLEEKMDAVIAKDREFAENSPMPPAELAAQGVYCTGDDCHKVAPRWERNQSEVMPPKSNVVAVWNVQGFGAGQGSGGKNAPIHFGDTPAAREEAANQAKLSPKTPAQVASNGAAKSPGKSPNRAPTHTDARGNDKKSAKSPAGKARR
jgi:hypothetical protein